MPTLNRFSNNLRRATDRLSSLGSDAFSLGSNALQGVASRGGGQALGTAAGYLSGGPVGGAIGGLLGKGIGDFLKPSNPNDALRQNLMQQLQQKYQFNPVSFDPIAQGEQRRFQQETIPGLAERFGGLDAQRSSSFAQQLGGAGADLSSRLAALRSQHEAGQQQAGFQAEGIDQNRMAALQNMLNQEQAQQMAQENQYAQLANLIPQNYFRNEELEFGKARDINDAASRRQNDALNRFILASNSALAPEGQQVMMPGMSQNNSNISNQILDFLKKMGIETSKVAGGYAAGGAPGVLNALAR